MGYLDLLGPSRTQSTGFTQNLMLSRAVPAIYERWWRPALGRVAKGALGPGMDGELAEARSLLALRPGIKVLDLACGTGNFTRPFARMVGPDGLAVGIDVSETMLARAVRDTQYAGAANAAYVRGDAVELPFRDGSFDAVCCFAALHLFADPMRSLDRITAVLAPRGAVAVFTSARMRSAPMRAIGSVAGRRSGMRVFGEDEIVDALRERRFIGIRRRLAGLTQFVGGRLAE